MISIVLRAETAYLATFENRQISIMKKKMVCYEKSIKKVSYQISAWFAPQELGGMGEGGCFNIMEKITDPHLNAGGGDSASKLIVGRGCPLIRFFIFHFSYIYIYIYI